MNVNDGLQNLQQVLEISGTNPVSPVSQIQRQPQQSAAPASAGAVQDRAVVSTAASLANQAMAVPDVRMNKVASVQQSLASGTYQVSASDVTDKLMNHMLGK